MPQMKLVIQLSWAVSIQLIPGMKPANAWALSRELARNAGAFRASPWRFSFPLGATAQEIRPPRLAEPSFRPLWPNAQAIGANR